MHGATTNEVPSPEGSAPGQDRSPVLTLSFTAFVPVTMLVQIPGLVTRVVVMRSGFLGLRGLVWVTMLVEIARLVPGMRMMFSRLFLRHRGLLLWALINNVRQEMKFHRRPG